MKRYALLICLLSVPSFASVVMIPEITPDPVISMEVGETMEISFMVDSPTTSFFGVVEWVGVGELSEPIYPGSPIIILPDPPYYPGFLPDNMWPIYYEMPLIPPPSMELFVITTYMADETGNATINLYDLGFDFAELTLIGSFDIVVVPEPVTAVLLSLGIFLIRRR